MKRFVWLISLIWIPCSIYAKGLSKEEFEKGTPPRIIRTCCAFGNNVGFVGVPFLKMSDIIACEDIGRHQYLGGGSEKNGIIYTYKGGFIDTGHLRDQADWTAYIHALIMQNMGEENFEIALGYEGGKKMLKLSIPKNFSNEDAALLAGRIAYDLSVWHEIATWYGASSIPLIPERYSSFSAEDDYSNQLGVNLGIEAILSDEPYDSAMAKHLLRKLDDLKVVKTIDESYQAMDMVNGAWWSKTYKLPNKNFLLKHQIPTYGKTNPLLVDQMNHLALDPEPVEIAKTTRGKIPFENFYSFEIKANRKIPYSRIFRIKSSNRSINNNDFGHLLENIHRETQFIKYRKLKRKEARKQAGR